MVSAGNRDASDWGVTDDNGRVKLQIPPGEYGFRILPATGTPYLLTSKRGIKISLPEAEESVVLRLRPAAIVEIIAQDADTGVPLEHVDYYVIDPQNEDHHINHYSRSFDAATNKSQVDYARTDKNGRLQALFEAGTYRIGVGNQFRQTGYEVVEPEWQEVECKAGERVKVKFLLRKPR
jgi:hypothetical protein